MLPLYHHVYREKSILTVIVRISRQTAYREERGGSGRKRGTRRRAGACRYARTRVRRVSFNLIHDSYGLVSLQLLVRRLPPGKTFSV